MGQLDNKVAIITGASRGIGKSIASTFIAEGAKVVMAARDTETLKRASVELKTGNAIILPIPTDVTNESQVIALFEKVNKELGRIDILINNAGTTEMAPIDDLTIAQWCKVIDVNLTGTFLCSREAMKVMKDQGRGRIINIGSVSSQMPRKNSVPYSTSKSGVIGLTKATALEGRDYDVIASCVQPGNVYSTLTADLDMDVQTEAMLTPEQVADVVLTMAKLPPDVNMFNSIILPLDMPYLGRG